MDSRSICIFIAILFLLFLFTDEQSFLNAAFAFGLVGLMAWASALKNGEAWTSQGRRQKQGEDVVHCLKVSLEDVYNGTSKKLLFSRNVLCTKCKGKRDRCPKCKGNKITQEMKVLEVHVEKGMQQDQKIAFKGEADEAPDTITGDIVFVLQVKKHQKFKRVQDDLYIDHNLSLTEALCGFQFSVTHLDGRQLLIKSNPRGEVIKPGQTKAINDEGMPQYNRPFMRGCLYIKFNINFPDSGFLSLSQCQVLEKALPQKTSKHLSAMELHDCEETTLYDVDLAEINRKKHRHQYRDQAYDEEDDDDDEDSSGPRVQCAQQ